jgi:hypothetical protein
VNARIITLTDENGAALRDEQGRPIKWVPLEVRMPEFLTAYPPKEGFRIVCETVDLLSFRKGLLSILKEAIAAGRRLGDLGLVDLEQTLTELICTARLFDRDDRILRTASACARVQEEKDYERLESAATNRLITALGFGGQISHEEAAALEQQGSGSSAPLEPGAAPEVPIESRERAAVESRGPEREVRDGQTSTTPTPSARRERTPLVALPKDPESRPAQKDSAEGVTSAQRVQVANLARRAGVEAPQLATRADFDRAMRELGSQNRTGSGTAASSAGATSRPQAAAGRAVSK